MTTRIIMPALLFMMKYFFDIEKEITQSVLLSCQVRLMDCKEVLTNIYQVAISNRLDLMS
jgi:hypothetical protein